MQASLHRRYLEELLGSTEASRGLAAECYREPAFFELELEHILRPAWHAVARWDDLPETGDYAAVDLCGEPLVIVRDNKRQLRVFSRVCRHRGHTVVEGCGNAQRFVCPYHRWTYGLDGRLRGAPLMKGTPGFDPTSCGLPELRTETWQGFLLVSLAPDPQPITRELGALDKKLAPHRLAEMVTVGRLDFDSPWNWKVMVDNFMESYHHLGVHADTLQKTNPAKDTYCADVEGPFSVLEHPGANGSPSFSVLQVFPTLLFFLQEGSSIGGWYEMQIDRHDHFHLRLHTLATPELAEGGIEKLLNDFQLKIHLEDIPVCEAVQRGMSSRLWQPSPLSVQEGCLIRFRRYLAERLSA